MKINSLINNRFGTSSPSTIYWFGYFDAVITIAIIAGLAFASKHIH